MPRQRQIIDRARCPLRCRLGVERVEDADVEQIGVVLQARDHVVFDQTSGEVLQREGEQQTGPDQHQGHGKREATEQ